MSAFDAMILPSIGVSQLLGLESWLLEAVAARGCPPVLVVHAMPGRMLSIGRYHLYSGPPERGGLIGWRRLTGGRVVGSGEGWVGLALVLPSRAALLPARDAKLGPEQVMNRHVRGLLGGLRVLGLDCFYPGRDAVTVAQREIAMCAFESDASGATLFETLVAVNRGMEEAVHDLERFDPDGHLTCAMYGPDSASKLVRELDRDVSFAEVAGAMVRGYSDFLGGANRRDLSPLEIVQSERRAAAFGQSGWLSGAPALTGCLASRAPSQLGAIEARIELGPDGSIARFQLRGDFIANSPAIRAFESEMAGKRIELPAVSAAVMKIFAHGDNFILGIGDLSNLVNLVMRAR